MAGEGPLANDNSYGEKDHTSVMGPSACDWEAVVVVQSPLSKRQVRVLHASSHTRSPPTLVQSCGHRDAGVQSPPSKRQLGATHAASQRPLWKRAVQLGSGHSAHGLTAGRVPGTTMRVRSTALMAVQAGGRKPSRQTH